MEYITITSAQNAALKHLVKLRDRRTRDKENLTILEGYRELTRSREYGMELVECYFSPEHFLGSNEFPLLEEIASSGVKVTRLAYGIPVGGNLEFADDATLMRALEGRQEI